MPSDEVAEEVLDAEGGLVGRRASASEWDLEGHAHGEVAIAQGRVLCHHGLACGEALIGVVGDGEVSLVGSLEGVGGVVLVEAVASAGAVDGDQDEAVGRDAIDVGDVVGGGDEGGVGVEEVGNGHRGVVGRDGSESEKRGASADVVYGVVVAADEAVGGVEVVVAVELVVVDVALLPYHFHQFQYYRYY